MVVEDQPDPKGCVCAKSLQPRPAPCDAMDSGLPAPLSMGFSRQEDCSALPGLPPRDLPDPGIEPASLTSPAWQAGSLLLAPRGSPNRMDAFPLFHVILHGLFQVPCFHISLQLLPGTPLPLSSSGKCSHSLWSRHLFSEALLGSAGGTRVSFSAPREPRARTCHSPENTQLPPCWRTHRLGQEISTLCLVQNCPVLDTH